jgi:tetratricopeptide (TPR) repeat protein
VRWELSRHLRQAIEHCDQALRIADFFLEQPNHPLVGKAYQRRATAHCMLSNFKLAVADFERALQKDPTSKEVGVRLRLRRRPSLNPRMLTAALSTASSLRETARHHHRVSAPPTTQPGRVRIGAKATIRVGGACMLCCWANSNATPPHPHNRFRSSWRAPRRTWRSTTRRKR